MKNPVRSAMVLAVTGAIAVGLGLSACGTRGEEADYNNEYVPDLAPSESVAPEWTDLGNYLQSRTVKVGETECLIVLRFDAFVVSCPGHADVSSGVTP